MFEFDFDGTFSFAGMNDLWQVVMPAYEFQFFLACFLVWGCVYIIVYHRAKQRDYSFVLRVNSILYAIQLPIYMTAVFFFLFSKRLDLVAEPTWYAFTAMVPSRLFSYLLDVVLQEKSGKNPLIVAHHLVWLFLLSLVITTRDLITIRVSVILDGISLFEFGLFWLLNESKRSNRLLSPRVQQRGRMAIVLYALVQPIQAVLLWYTLVKSREGMFRYDHAVIWVALCVCVLFLMYAQVYTISFYLKWKNLDWWWDRKSAQKVE